MSFGFSSTKNQKNEFNVNRYQKRKFCLLKGGQMR
jgi:hypothetical protein